MVTERYGILQRSGDKLGAIRRELLQWGSGNYDQPMISNLPDLSKLYIREAILEMLSAENKLTWALEELSKKTKGEGPVIEARVET